MTKYDKTLTMRAELLHFNPLAKGAKGTVELRSDLLLCVCLSFSRIITGRCARNWVRSEHLCGESALYHNC